MAGAAGMFPENKKFWKSALPKIKDYFDIANIHHISFPDGKCDRQFWVDEFASLLKSTNIKVFISFVSFKLKVLKYKNNNILAYLGNVSN